MNDRAKREDVGDADIETLLRTVGPRDEPSPEAVSTICEAVRVEWRAVVAGQRRVRRERRWAVAASLAVIVAGSLFGVQREREARVPIDVATIARVDGRLDGASPAGMSSPRATGESIKAGERLQTDDHSRAALRYPDGLSVRLDHNTVVKLTAVDRIVLVAGAVYIDSTSENGSPSLIVETRAASIRHVGTQYQVRDSMNGVELSVREGRVAIRQGTREAAALAGESVRIATAGALSRSRIVAWDARWRWVAEIAPTFSVDDASAADFLAWYAREHGRHVVFATPQARQAARETRLGGPIAALDPETALQAVLATTGLRKYETNPDSIVIDLALTTDPRASTRPTQ